MEVPDPLMPLWALELTTKVLLYAWLFALGGTVGSFLNVVVYRLPRGKNLAIPGSACPQCGHAIRLSDNVPILSWLALQGRCRDCGGRIAPRYLLVEALVATTFLVVLAGELFLPAGALGSVARRALTPYDGAPFWAMYGLHLLLVVTIYAAVLIAADGFDVPRRLYLPLLVVGLLLPMLWPDIRSLAAVGTRLSGWQAAAVDGLTGMALGAVVGSVAASLLRSRASIFPRLRCVSLGAAVGLIFGWQRAMWMGPLLLAGASLAVFGLRSLSTPVSAPEESPPEDVSLPEISTEISATTAVLPDPETISEEVHIVSPPTEPTEPS